MSMIQSDLLLGQEGGAGYVVQRSLRFSSIDSAYLSRTPASAGNRKTWTWAGWVKRSAITSSASYLYGLFSAESSGSDYAYIDFYQDGLRVTLRPPSGTQAVLQTTQVFRDPSAWYHIVVAQDTTQATASNRIKCYVNGSQITSFSTSTYPDLDAQGAVNQAVAHNVGRDLANVLYSTNQGALDGYLADVHFIDGQALTPSSFTEVSATTGQLIPKAYTGTFTGNSFWLKFADNSAATATTLGKDSSGLGNNWTPNNLTATELYGRLYRQATGTATSAFSSANLVGNFPASASGNYIYDVELNTSVTTATFGYLHAFGGVEVLVSNDGTNWTSKGVQTNAYTTVTNSTPFKYVRWFIAQSWMHGITNNPANIDSTVDTPTSSGTDTGLGGQVTGNYCTMNPLSGGTFTNGNLDQSSSDVNNYGTFAVSSGKWYYEATISTQTGSGVGGQKIGLAKQGAAFELGNDANGWAMTVQNNTSNGNAINNGTQTSSYTTFTTNDVVMCAFDVDAGKIWWGKNGTWLNSGAPASGTNAIYTNLTGPVFPAAIARNGSAFTWNFGQRPFAYTAPSGFKALCDTNLPAPVVAKPSSAFDVKLYTGNGSTQTISGLGFSPDLVWLKCRSAANTHALVDSVRGATKYLVSAATDAEVTDSGGITSLNSDGFSLTFPTSTAPTINANSATYAAWCWDAGTTTTTNTQGSITSQVRANASAGFSIVTFTGPASAGFGSVGHGLNAKPKFILCKDRSNARNWSVYHESVVTTDYKAFILNSTSAVFDSGTPTWDVSEINSTIFTPYFRDDFGASYNANNVAYCFSPVAGYSSFGSYVGNGSSDGVFVYTGFRPRWVMIKASSSTGDWYIIDTSRDTYNLSGKSLQANTSNAEPSVGGPFSTTDDILSNGFKLRDGGSGSNGSSVTYVYAAFAENPFQYARAR